MVPVFDMNISLLPYVEEKEFGEIGMKLLEYGPKIGEDFTRTGQLVMTPKIRSDLVGLKGFEFSFQGNERFPKWRVKKLEEMVNLQIEALLSKEVLLTRDVLDVRTEHCRPGSVHAGTYPQREPGSLTS